MKRFANRKNTPADASTDKFRARNNPANVGASSPKKIKRWQGQARPDETPVIYNDTPTAYGRHEERTMGSYGMDQQQPDGEGSAESYRSIAPTVATNQDTTMSDVDHQSKAGTTNTLGGGVSTVSGGGNSIFTSPNHSDHSLTTTLTTMQSQATFQHPFNPMHTQHPSPYLPSQYSQIGAGGLRSHLQPTSSHVPLTYRSATANNLLTDNASVLTLASSSHRRHRRNSVDTDASIRAIRPTSTWGGSRESLPLSVLSQNIEYAPGPAPALLPSSRSIVRDERASVHNGVGAPVLSSDRNSIYTGKTQGSVMDQGSVRSDRFGHARNGSTTGSFWAKENFAEGYIHGERSG